MQNEFLRILVNIIWKVWIKKIGHNRIAFLTVWQTLLDMAPALKAITGCRGYSINSPDLVSMS